MRTLCAILLVGVVTYVRAHHDCAPFAVNVEGSTIERNYNNVNEKYLSLRDALLKIQGVFGTSHATPTTIEAVAQRGICTFATYGMGNCGRVEYATKSNQNPNTINRDSSFEGIQFKTTFIGYDKILKQCVEYHMVFRGGDKDNYIFEWVNNTDRAPMQFNEGNHNTAWLIQIPVEIDNVLKSDFALYSYKIGKYNLYVACDGKAAWVTHKTTNNEPDETDAELQNDIEKLKTLVKQTKDIDLEVKKTNPEFPNGLTEYLTNMYKLCYEHF